jgi:hypothetical protein
MPQDERHHFGTGDLQADAAQSVFINCPYDDEFSAKFDAIVFTVVSCGFLPRSALESGTVADSRMDRIISAMFSSKYSIHDLSRCKGEGNELLARFNMPLELGIAMALRHIEPDATAKHDWLMLVPEVHPYARFISDLAGFDASRYDGKVETLVPKVVSWLASRRDAVRTPRPKRVLQALPTFAAERRVLNDDWGADNVPWGDIILAARQIADQLFS